jgi:hypothetical protein
MDVRRALTTIADDPDVKTKIKVGVFMVSAPIISIAAVGYQVQMARQVVAGVEAPLPDWDDLGRLFRQGFGLALAGLIYEIPARLLLLATLLLALRPLWLASEAAQPLAAGPAWQSLQILAMGLKLGLLYNLAYGFLAPAIMAQFVRHGTLRACFNLGGLWRFIVRQPRAYMKVWAVRELAGLVARLAGMGLGMVVGVLPLVGPLASTVTWGWLLFVSRLLNGSLVGQLLRLEDGRPLYQPASAPALIPAPEA